MRGLIKTDLAYPALWKGCVGAWCPSVDRSRGTSLTDWSPNRNHGTLMSMDPATGWIVSGGYGALDFDGSNDFIEAPTVSISNTISISFFVFRSSNVCYFIEKLPTFDNWAVLNEGTNLILRAGTGATDLSVSGGLSSSIWTHVVGVISGTISTLYRNGILLATGSNSVGIGNSTGVINIARYGSFGGGYYANAKIDDIRLYNRALTPPEIQLLSRRRGIAYETSPQRSYRAAAATKRFALMRPSVMRSAS